MVRIAILILNYNGIKHLKALLPHIEFFKEEPSADVYVIDNASYDGSMEWLKEKAPWVMGVINEENYGWGEGYNRGVAKIRQNGIAYTHYMFINNDVIPSPEWYQKLKEAAEKAAPDIGEIGCRAVFTTPFVEDELFTWDTKQDVTLFLLPENAHNRVMKNKKDKGSQAFYVLNLLNENQLSPSLQKAFCIPKEAEVHGWYMAQVLNSAKTPLKVTISPHLKVSSKSESDKLVLWTITDRASEGAGPAKENILEIPAEGKVLFIRAITNKAKVVSLIQNSGIGLNKRFEGFDLHCYEPSYLAQSHRDVAGVCGVCKIVKVKAFQDVGGFDPQYFMYYEDLDFSLELHKHGYKSIVVPEAILPHVHSGTSDAMSLFFRRQVNWSLYYFHFKQAPLTRKIITWMKYKNKAYREINWDVYSPMKIYSRTLKKFKDTVGGHYLVSQQSTKKEALNVKQHSSTLV